jgi:membrane protein DedA with SNARE-associated domain
MTGRPLEGAPVQQLQHLAENLITHYGYLAVFVLMLAESACIPVPSEVVMMFGGAMAAGALGGSGAPPSLIGVVAAGVLGNVAGSYLAWAVGKYAGRATIGRWGRLIGIREHEIDRAVAWFERHGPVAVLVGRVIPVIRTFISLPAGFAGMPASQFGLYTVLGCIPWTAALGIAGYALGANWDSVAKAFNAPTYAIAGILLVGLIVILVRRRRARNALQASSGVNPGMAGPNGPAIPVSPAAPHVRPGGSVGAFPGQQPSPYGRGPRDTYGPPDTYRSRDAYGPQDGYGPQDASGGQQGASGGPRDAYRPQEPRGPRDEWSGGPQDPWAQPTGRPNRRPS